MILGGSMYRLNSFYLKIFLGIVSLCFVRQVHAHPLVFIKLSIQEALPDDPSKSTFQLIKGVDRKQELVTFGVPLPNDTSAFEISQLLFVGSNQVQYQILRRWNTQRIQWLLVDALVDVKAGQIRKDTFLTNGTYLKSKPLGQKRAKDILIDTGAATFWISRTSFNLLERVEVGGKEIVAPGSSLGIVLTDPQGQEYTSRLDSKISVELETNGPIRSVVRAQGRHTAPNGKDWLDFTIRMHFVKGKSYVRMFYTLRNASKRRLENVRFRSVELVLKTKQKNTQFTIRNHTGETQGSLSSGVSTVRVFQGKNAFPVVRDKGSDPSFWMTNKKGYTIEKDGSVLQSGTADQPIRMLYAQARASDGSGVTFGTRFAAGWAPQGLSVQGDGTIRIGVFPKGNDKLYTIRFGAHWTREHIFHFHAKKTEPYSTFFRFQYPLIARPQEADWFNQDEMLFIRLVSFKEETDFYKKKKWPTSDHATATTRRRPTFRIPRFLNWSSSAPLRQWSLGLMNALNYLREEQAYAGVYYLAAEQWMAYNADYSVQHSDDYNNAFVRREVSELVASDGRIKDFRDLPNAQFVSPASTIWTGTNHHAYSLSYWYYLTGHARFAGALRSWGQRLLRLPMDAKDTRTFGWSIYNLTRLYRFTRQIEYHSTAWDAIKTHALDASAVPGKTGGTDWERGFFVDTTLAKSSKRIVSTANQARILAGAYAFFLEFGTRSEQQKDRMLDLLEGLTRFVQRELWVESSQKAGEYGLPPTYPLDSPPPQRPTQIPDWDAGIQHGFLAFYFGFIMTSEASFLKRAEWLLRSTAYNPGRVYWFQDLPGRHMVQYLLVNTPLYTTWKSLPIRAVRQPNGRYTLTLKTPYGAKAYRIKYSEKQIVPSLEFDAQKRTFRWDPKRYIPFFAATNLDKEPQPGDPSLFQEMQTPVLDKDKTYYFAARYFSSDPRPPFTDWLPDAGPTEDPQPDAGTPERRRERTQTPDERNTDSTQPTEFLEPTSSDEPGSSDTLPIDSKPSPGCNCQSSITGHSWPTLWLILLLGFGITRRKKERTCSKS